MHAIETSGLTKYYGKTPGIIDVNISVVQGEIFGFIGPNGSGKSTTIRTLLNFLHPTSGEARILGRDCFSQSREIKYKTGYLPAETNYYENMTVGELLRYSAKFYGRKYDRRIKRLAGLFELDLKKRMEHLSLGNKKKVAIIQSLLHEPQLLIMDEPTSGLDPLMQHQLFNLLHEENQQGTTIFFSSHLLGQVQEFCQRIAIIKDGRVMDIEKVDKLRERQMKRIKIEFSSPEERQEFDIDHVVESRTSGNSVEILYNGEINSLLQILAAQNIRNLVIEEPSLEEIFMHYYEGK